MNLKLIYLLLVNFILTAPVFSNDEFVLNSETVFNPSFQNHFSFLMGLNPSIDKSGDISSLVFSYAKKMDEFWLDTNLLVTNGIFNKITTNNSLATGLTDSQLADSKSSMMTFGAGIARESHYFQNIIPITNIYETMSANLTYNIFKETISQTSFSGPGLMTKFSLDKRFSNYFSIGSQFIYNLAVVKRSAKDSSENSSDRSLTMSYFTVGFDLSFYL